jgi:hypothetical protein
LRSIANPPYLSGFLFSSLLRVAPYCVPGGVRSGVNTTIVTGDIGSHAHHYPSVQMILLTAGEVDAHEDNRPAYELLDP